MSIEQVIRSRRTVHSYIKEEVPEELMAQALKLATFAPNHKLTFPFQFIRVGKVTRRKLADLAVELKLKKDPDKDFVYPNPNEVADPSVRPQYKNPLYFIDLRSQNLNAQISENFKALDFISEKKGPYAVLSRTLINALQGLRTELGKAIFPTSGYRSPGYNKKISGAAKFSRHTYGDAVDFFAEDTEFGELQDLCEKYGASFTLIYETHIHCDWRLRPLDTAFYGPSSNSRQLEPLPYHEITGGEIVTLIYGDYIELTVEDFFIEEPGAFLYNWNVVTPSGDIIESNSATLQLKPVPGTYRISVLVGNSVQLNEVLEW